MPKRQKKFFTGGFTGKREKGGENGLEKKGKR